METPINQANKTEAGGDFMNRPHESFFHQAGIPPVTLASLYRQHRVESALTVPAEGIRKAEAFCRTAKVIGFDTTTDLGFGWVLVARGDDLFRGELALRGRTVPFMAYSSMHGPDLEREVLVWAADINAGNSHVSQALNRLSQRKRHDLFSEIRDSLVLAQANQATAGRLRALQMEVRRNQADLPPFDALTFARLLQHYDVPEAPAKDTAAWLVQTHGDRLSTMGGAEVLGAAYAFNSHPGLVSGPPWQSWLCECIAEGNESGMEACLSMGADPNVPNAQGEMPLHTAAHMGRLGSIQRLLEVGADPTCGNHSGETPLHHAAQSGHAEACLVLMAGGADPGQLDYAGRKPGAPQRNAGPGHARL